MSNFESTLRSLQIIYHAQSAPSERISAHQDIEIFEESFAQTPLVAFELASSSNPLPLRHFGLHLLENFLKYKWSQCANDVRNNIKQSLLKFITLDCQNILIEDILIKESVARCLTELTKKLWPQRWPEYFVDCRNIYSAGFCQCQIVVLCWNKLLEDVIVYQTVEPSRRRRELYEFILTNSGQFFNLSAIVLNESLEILKLSDDPTRLSLLLTSLELMSNILEWIPSVDFQVHGCQVLSGLCQLLHHESSPKAQTLAAQCLQQFSVRNFGKKDEESEIIFMLFTDDNVQLIIDSVKNSCYAAGGNLEQNYIILKYLCTFLVSLSQSLALILECFPSEKLLRPIEVVGDALLLFLQHPSLLLKSQAATGLGVFLKDNNKLLLHSNESTILMKLFSNFVNLIPTIIQLVGYPSKNDSPYSDYSKLDFDSDSDYLLEFCKFREYCCTLLRKIVRLDYHTAYSILLNWVTAKLKRENLHNLSTLEWDGMIRFANNVITTIAKDSKVFQSEAIKNDAKIILEIVFTLIDMDDFQISIADLTLSTWSAFFPLLSLDSDLVLPIVSILFRIGLVNDESESGRKIRHHAVHEFVHLCVAHTAILSPHLESVLTEMEKYNSVLTLRQKCSLAEAIVILGNKYANFEKQKSIVEYLTSASVRYFSSPEITDCLSSPFNFAKYIGLFEQAPEVISNQELYFGRKKELSSNLQMLVGVLNRLKIPDDYQQIKIGGYLLDSDEKPNHPMFVSVQPIFAQLFCLARCLNGLYSAPIIQNIHSSYGGFKVLDLTDSEKNFNMTAFMTSLSQIKECQTPVEQTKLFVSEMTDKIQIALGLVMSKFGWQFYELNQSALFLMHGVLGHLDDCLDQRLRFWIRRCLTPLVLSISGYIDKALPALCHVIGHVFWRLSNRWQLIVTRLEQSQTTGEDLTKQEIFFDDSTRLLTRDYLNFVETAIRVLNRKRHVGWHGNSLATATEKEQDEEMADDNNDVVEDGQNDDVIANNDVSSNQNSINNSKFSITPLGIALLNPQNNCVGPLTLSVFSALTWLDTYSVSKSCQIALLIVNQLLNSQVLDETTAVHLFCCVLNSIQLHGEHDTLLPNLLTLGYGLYELLAFQFEQINRMMLEIPGCTESKLQSYNKKLFESKSKFESLPDKFRRDSFKSLIKGIIGTNLGQKFKRKPTRAIDLPPLLRSKRFKPVLEMNGDLAICNLFMVQS